MKNTWKRFAALFLSLALCTAAILPLMAANESNTLGVFFGVTLDKPTLSVSDADQMVVMTLSANQAITLDGLGFTVTQDSPLTLTSIAGNGDTIVLEAKDVNLANGKAGWGSEDGENVTGVTKLATVTFTVPANTPAGTYSVGVNSIIVTKDYTMDEWENGATAAATLTVTDGNSSAYTAGVAASSSEVTVGDTVYANVSVNQAFAAAELAVSYTAATLTFNESASTLNGATVTVNGGTLTIIDHGESQTAGVAYRLAFTAAADGAAAVTLTDAAFSERDSAKTEDLTAASISPAAASITVKKASHTVQLPEILTGNTAASGTVTVPGTAVTQNITVTIDQVQADATVAVEGTGASDVTSFTPYATPGTAYTLTVNKNAAYTYTVTAAVNGSTVALSESGNTYTIAAADVKVGAIVFTVNKSLPTAGISVSQYLQLDETSLWRVRNTAACVDGSVYNYKGTAMFWSEKYNAYCILVAAASLTADDVTASDLQLTSGTTVSVSYDYDVNKSGKVDANDAQLVYNMYKADYAGFDADVTMEKFLHADVNGSGSVNVDDAAAIVAELLG